MYILGISGSPRKGGNTEALLDKALLGAESKDAKTEKVILNNLKMVPCQECEKVKDDGTCKIEDDFQALYEKIKKADALVLASPIFFGSLSAQTKIMIDRFQCLWRYKYVLHGTTDEGRLSSEATRESNVAKEEGTKDEKKRPGALILVEASRRESFFENAKAIVKNLFATIEADYTKELFCPGLEGKGDVLKHQDLLQKAFKLGEELR